MNKLLIIQTAFIGDVILATSLVEKLHRHYPSAAIDVLVRKGNESLLDNNPRVNKVLIWDKKSNKYKNLFRLKKDIKNEQYDAVINLQRFAATGYLTAFSKAQQRIGFQSNPFAIFFNKRVKHIMKKGNHEVDRNIALISHLTNGYRELPKLYPSVKDFENTFQYKEKKYICLAPSSVWFTKQLPLNKWQEIIDKTPADTNIYLLGGPADKNYCDQLSTKESNLKNLCGELSFLESAALMKDADMNHVNDSAPLHITSAMNAKVTAYFCSTIPEFGFGPLANDAKIIESNKELDCRPCGIHGKRECPKGHFECGQSIRID